MEPREVAELVMDRVVNYCEHNSGDGTLECLADHNPDELDMFVDSYLKENEAKDLDKAIETSDTFWDEVKKEYEAMWDEEMSLQLGHYLGDELEALYEEIIQNDLISDSSKVRRLKAYEEVLEEFADAIDRALKEKKPLTELELLHWYDKIGDAVFGFKNYNYYEIMGYYIGFYDTLSNSQKLEMLSGLLDVIADVLYDIDKDLSELGALTNKS